LLILILKTPPVIAIGVMIIAAAPGGVTSNILTKFANGDVALSISLTAVISLIGIITVPLIIFTSADLFGITNITQNISMTGIALKMFLVVTVPVVLGMVIRYFFENFIASKVNIFNKLNIILFAIFFVAAFYEERENLLGFIAQAGLIALILNISMMVIAYYLAKTFCFSNSYSFSVISSSESQRLSVLNRSSLALTGPEPFVILVGNSFRYTSTNSGE